MNDKNLHINQQLNSNYPEPDIPADDAWANMDAMLTAQAPPPPSKGGAVSGGAAGGFWRLVLLITVVAGVIFLVVNNLTKKSNLGVTQEHPDNTAVTQLLSNTDTISKNNTLTPSDVLSKPGSLDKNNSDTRINDNQNKSTQATASANNENKPGDQHPVNQNHTENNVVKNSQTNILNKTIAEPAGTNFQSKNNNKGKNVETVKLNNADTLLSVNNTNTTDKISSIGTAKMDTKNPQQRHDENNSNLFLKNDTKFFEYNKISLINDNRSIAPQLPVGLSASNSKNTLKGMLDKENKLAVNSSSKRNNNTGAINYGLQLNVNLALQNTCICNYFKDGGGKNQPLKLLIPGIWVSKRFGKRNEVLLQFNPYQQYFTGNKLLSSIISYPPQSSPDDALLSTINLIKTTGLSAGIQYNYYLNSKWNIGAGIDYNIQSAALLSEQITRVHDQKIMQYKVYGIKKFKRFFPIHQPFIYYR
ncbi:MAG: hypothetical protein IPJ81_04775 [Chitinophagaceae bacterium]|nr:hypothetical protein [Chitinophagaceae bacterium]